MVRYIWITTLLSLIGLHYVVLGLVTIAAITSFSHFPFPIAAAFCVMCIRIGSSRSPCPLTDMENKVRKIIGLPTIKSFITTFLLHPIKSFSSLIDDIRKLQ